MTTDDDDVGRAKVIMSAIHGFNRGKVMQPMQARLSGCGGFVGV